MKTNRLLSLVLLGVSALALSSVIVRGQSSAQTKTLVNIDSQGVGAHGYDPVAFFTEGKAVKGRPNGTALIAEPFITFSRAQTVTSSTRNQRGMLPNMAGIVPWP